MSRTKTKTKIVTEQKLLNFLVIKIEELERTTQKIDNVYLLGKFVAYKEMYKFITRGIDETE